MSMRKVLLGHIGVDSGQVMFVDPCYVKSFKSDEFLSMDENMEKAYYDKHRGEFSYSGACIATDTKGKPGGELGDGMAVVCGTLYGDGTYPVYAYVDERGRAARVEVDFR